MANHPASGVTPKDLKNQLTSQLNVTGQLTVTEPQVITAGSNMVEQRALMHESYVEQIASGNGNPSNP